MEETQKAILAGVNINKHPQFLYSMEELENLAKACEVTVVGQVTQNLQKVNQTTYIGSGKLDEILEELKTSGAEIVIFNDELSPSQIRNIEEHLACKVIDRTMLILDIFSERANTREAQLQVEVAALQYMLPRLVGLRESLGRQVGGVGTKNRGVGEKKLELDRRHIEDRIALLRKELKELTAHRKTQRKQRLKSGMPAAALVGYTNAGKSTLMNAMLTRYGGMEDKQVLEKDMLFATLETAVRKITLPGNKQFLLTDTVGFIDKLPHHLVKAFRSTLEEVKEADLLIHVVDVSNADYFEQIRVTEETLAEIGVTEIPIMYAYNKWDAVHDVYEQTVKENAIFLSAKYGDGVEELVTLVAKSLFDDHVSCEMLIPYDKGAVVSYFKENASVTHLSHEAEGVRMKLTCSKKDAGKYKVYRVESLDKEQGDC